MTVLDSSLAIDYLLGWGRARDVQRLLIREREVTAPDVLVFEVVAALRRLALRRAAPVRQLEAAVTDLGDLAIELYPSLPLRRRAFTLRENLGAGDALFVALAEQLDEPLATKDAGLARAAAQIGVPTVAL